MKIPKLFHLKIIAIIAALLITPQTAIASDKLTILLDWFINPDHAPLFVAQERGYFEKHGLEVEMIAPADPNDPPKLVAARQADIAVSYQPQLHIQVDAGLPLVRFGTLVATPLNTLLVLEDSPIKTIQDLKGKKVGYSIGGFEDALLRAMLEKYDLTLNDIELINVNFSLSPALLSGQVDAVIGAFRNFELNQLEIEGYKGRAFYVEEQGVPSYDELILVANSEVINKPVLRRFLDALEEGVQYLINHPTESWALFIRSRENLDDELNRRAWRDTLRRFALRPAALDVNRYAEFADFMKIQGLIRKTPPISTYAITLE